MCPLAFRVEFKPMRMLRQNLVHLKHILYSIEEERYGAAKSILGRLRGSSRKVSANMNKQ